MSTSAVKRLLVEGKDDIYAIAQLMGHHVNWTPPPVRIVDCNGDEILRPGRISVELKSYPVVGVMIDADTSGPNRWQRVRSEGLMVFPDLPQELPAEGLVASNDQGQKFGVWLMPDNRQDGMMETFLQWLVPGDQQSLWKHAISATTAAKEHHNAAFTVSHYDKARIHSWLAWMDPPGESLGSAIRAKILDPGSDRAKPFISWFRRLFDV